MTEHEFIEILRLKSSQEESENPSDWGRSRPLTVDLKNLLISRYPRHRFCNLILKKSDYHYAGLYCHDHGKLLTWLNSYQFEYLEFLGFSETQPRSWTPPAPEIKYDGASPYALVYKNGQVFTIYVTIDSEQYKFYWNENRQAEHRQPRIRTTGEILENCYVRLLNSYSVQIVIDNIPLEFVWENKKSKDTSIVYRGPLSTIGGQIFEPDRTPPHQANSPTSSGQYLGEYSGHYSEPQPYEEE